MFGFEIDIEGGATPNSRYVIELPEVPQAVGLVLQLLCSRIANQIL